MINVTERQIKLIKLMIDKQTYRPANYYANKLNVSKRTIFNDLRKIEEQLKEYDVSIDKRPNQGIKLNGEMVSSGMFTQLIKKKIVEGSDSFFSSIDRQILIVKWLLIENKTLTYQSLSFDLFCSTSVLNKDFEQLQYFMDEEVFLKSDVKGTRIEGTEIGIQRTIKRFVYFILDEKINQYTDQSYIQHLKVLFEKETVQSVGQIMEELVSIINKNTSEQYLKSLFIFLLILTERSSKGFHIKTLSKTEWKKEEYLSNYPLAVQIASNISSILHFSFTEIEIQHISNQLFAHRIEVKLNNKYIENLLKKDVNDIIKSVSSTMKIDLSKDEKLYNSLTYHMFPLIYRLKTNISIHNPLLVEIKNNYSTLFKMVWYAVESFENKYDVKMSDNEVTFLTIYFQAAIERKIEMREVLVVCQTGVVTSDLIINRIKNLLPINIKFKLIAKPELQYENISKVDFIISSVTLNKEPKPVVYVSPLIKESDLINIYSFYLKYSSSKKILGKNEKINAKSLFLDHKYIYLNENLIEKEQCLDKMINDFEKDNIVTKKFKQTVYQREKLGNTIIQGLIATPHGNKNEVKTSKISMMLARSPVKWNRESSVSLIVLLAVTEQDMGDIRELLGSFFRNLISMESIENYLSNISTKEELIKLFYYLK